MNEPPEALLFLALLGLSENPKGELCDYLRSDAPLTRKHRERLAAMIEGSTIDGAKLTLSGHKGARDRHVGLQSRIRWTTIGEWITARLPDCTRAEAVILASTHFGASEETCDAALDYSRRLKRWRASLPDDHPFAIVMGSKIDWLFHAQDAIGEPLDAEGSDQHLADFN